MLYQTLFLALFLTLSACAPLVTSTPPLPPQPIQVAYPPSLGYWVAELQGCALQTPEIALTRLETSPIDPEFEEATLTLRFGTPSQGISGYAAAMGTDQIVIVAGSSVGLSQIDTDQLIRLYQSPGDRYHPWIYAAGSDLRDIFEEMILQGAAITPEAGLVPHPQAMLEAVAADPLAIGYLPKSWLMGNVKTLPLAEPLEIPILALTNEEPTDGLKSFLVCLQTRAESK